MAIKYKEQEIEQDAFLQQMANNVQDYVKNKNWSNKRKQQFLTAYSDIVKRGITGASVSDNGIWQVDYSDDQIDFSKMSQKQKDIYGEAAWFIRHQMDNFVGSPTKKEDIPNNNITKYTNENFVTNFNRHLSNTLFGGQNVSLANQWSELDPRDETGKRPTTRRASEMAKLLRSYSEGLSEDSYDFNDSPFKDLNDFKGRINEAIAALESPQIDDDNDALNKLGLDPNIYLRNGLSDIKGYLNDGETPVTYGQYAEQLAAQKALEEKQTQQQQELIQQQQNEQEQRKLEQRNQIFNQMRQNIRNFREKTFGENQPELTEKQLIANLIGIGADIASIVDPEPFSAAGLALAGSASRSVGGTNEGVWNKILDYGSSIVGAIPLLGDAAIATKVANNLRKLNGAFGAVSLYDLVLNGTGAEAASSLKNVFDGNANLKDWENVGKALRDIVVMRGTVRNNLTERTALQQSGVKTKVEEGQIGKLMERARKAGIIRTKPADSELNITSTVRMKSDTGDTVELKLEGASGQKLKEAFKGKSNKEKLETLKSLAESDDAIKAAISSQGINLSKIRSLDPSLRGSFFNLGAVRRFTGGSNNGIINTNNNGLKQIYRENTFQNYAEARRKMSPLKRFLQAETQGNLGAIRKQQRQYLNEIVKPTPFNSLEERNISSITNALFPTSKQLTRTTSTPKLEGGITERTTSKYDGRTIIKTIAKGKAETKYKDGSNVEHIIKWDDDYKTLFIDGKAVRTSGLHEAKKLLGEKVKEWEGISTKIDIRNKLSQEQVNRILDLRKKGFFLKQGGKIDLENEILNVIKNEYKI